MAEILDMECHLLSHGRRTLHVMMRNFIPRAHVAFFSRSFMPKTILEKNHVILWDLYQRVEGDVGYHMDLNLKAEGLFSFSTHKCAHPPFLACLESNLVRTLGYGTNEAMWCHLIAATPRSILNLAHGSIWFDQEARFEPNSNPI